MTLKISQSGIRGTLDQFDKIFSPIEILHFFLAIGQYHQNLKEGKVLIAIGQDGRRSSNALSFLARAALSSIGCDVINGGLIMTPTLQTNIRLSDEIDGGIMITASHNPIQFGGFKLFNSQGELLKNKELNQILEIKEEAEYPYKSFESFSKINPESYRDGFNKIHIDEILMKIPVDHIRKEKFKVAIDCCNSSGVILIEFLKRLDCEVYPINDQVSEEFSRSPEPSSRSLGELSEKVKSTNSDLGFALDPDGDRLVLVDDKGEILQEDYTFLILLDFLLKQNRPEKNVIGSCTISSAILKLIRNSNNEIVLHETKVGEKYLTEKINQLGIDNVLIAGEDSGSSIIPWINFSRDSMTNAGIVLTFLSQGGKKLTDIINELPRINRKKFKIPMDEKTISLIKGCIKSLKESIPTKSRELKISKSSINLLEGFDNPKIELKYSGEDFIKILFTENSISYALDLNNFISIDEIIFIKDNLSEKFYLNLIDGLKIFWETGYLLIRLSNTEPVMRLVLDYQGGCQNE